MLTVLGPVPVLLLLLFGIAAVVGSRALRVRPIVGYLLLGVALSATGLRTLLDAGAVQQASLSKRGQHSQSTAPSLATSAIV